MRPAKSTGTALFAVMVTCCLAMPVIEAAELIGRASVIDGDTLEIHGERIRLYGIDAPESRQLCQDENDKPYRCGQVAALALADRIGAATVHCEEKTRDRYRRMVAICFVDEIDLSEWLVSEGLALAFRRYSWRYVAAENTARIAQRGLWRGSFQSPWDWRQQHR